MKAYDINKYVGIWNRPTWSVDTRHILWVYKMLMSGYFRGHTLEIGSLHGAVTSAFVEALVEGRIDHSNHIDIEIQKEIWQLQSLTKKMNVFQCTSREYFQTYPTLKHSFVFIDGDHSYETGVMETEALLNTKPLCVMAHDTSTSVAKPGTADGPAYIKHAFQTHKDYYCLEDNRQRDNEVTWRGMFLATTSKPIFDYAKEALLEIQ